MFSPLIDEFSKFVQTVSDGQTVFDRESMILALESEALAVAVRVWTDQAGAYSLAHLQVAHLFAPLARKSAAEVAAEISVQELARKSAEEAARDNLAQELARGNSAEVVETGDFVR